MGGSIDGYPKGAMSGGTVSEEGAERSWTAET